MNILDWVLLAALAVALAFALRHVWRARKRGGCSGCSGCSGCAGCARGDCPQRRPNKPNEP